MASDLAGGYFHASFFSCEKLKSFVIMGVLSCQASAGPDRRLQMECYCNLILMRSNFVWNVPQFKFLLKKYYTTRMLIGHLLVYWYNSIVWCDNYWTTMRLLCFRNKWCVCDDLTGQRKVSDVGEGACHGSSRLARGVRIVRNLFLSSPSCLRIYKSPGTECRMHFSLFHCVCFPSRAIPRHGNKAEIVLTVLHRNFIGDEFLGQVGIPLSDFDVYDKPKNRWFNLKCKPGQDKTNYRGEIEVRVTFTVQSGVSTAGSVTELRKDGIRASFGQLSQKVGSSIGEPTKYISSSIAGTSFLCFNH